MTGESHEMTAPDGFAAYLRRLGLNAGPDGEQFTEEDAAGILHALRSASRASVQGAWARHPATQAAGPDLSSPLHEAAVSMHEAFTALVAAGFTEDQALKYLGWARPPAAE